MKEPKDFGIHYRQFIDNVQFVIQIFGQPTTKYFHKKGIRLGKEGGKTSYIERFNCAIRQRVSRLVRKTLSFSKKLGNHIGAIWNFVHHYNATLEIETV